MFKRTAEERNIKKTNKIGMSVIGILLSIGVSVGATGVANAATVTQNTVNGGIQELASTTTISDAELDALVTRLDQLPESVKQANPQDIPNYATKLNNFLAGGTFSDTPSLASRGKMSTLGTNWPKCVLEIGLLVVQYGIPVAKVIKWVKEAKAIWGGVKGIWWAITHGVAAAQIGGEGAKVLSGLLGTQGFINACFGA
ncbi:hypothetical protein [Bifidobacterium crudilactis]|uniref:hypothetical protein n=1 Tax=Bifidobacterium crudilactis TaxID=327277 RepID=UPI003A5C5C29